MKKSEIISSLVIGLIGLALGAIALAANSTAAKWILGILAVIIIIIAILWVLINSKAGIDIIAKGIVKIIKKSKEKPLSEKERAAMARKRDILFDSQRPTASDYGYTDFNPIMTSSISSTDEYLGRLRTLDGSSFTWERTGSLSVTEHCGVRNVIIDSYQLYLNGVKFKTIYICPYGHNHSYAPEGMMLVKEEKEE